MGCIKQSLVVIPHHENRSFSSMRGMNLNKEKETDRKGLRGGMDESDSKKKGVNGCKCLERFQGSRWN